MNVELNDFKYHDDLSLGLDPLFTDTNSNSKLVLDDVDVKIQAVFLDKTSSKKNYDEDGVIFVYEEQPLTLDVFGANLQKIRKLKFTSANNPAGGACAGSEGHYQVRDLLSTFSFLTFLLCTGI